MKVIRLKMPTAEERVMDYLRAVYGATHHVDDLRKRIISTITADREIKLEIPYGALELSRMEDR